MFKELLHDSWPIIEKFAPSVSTALGSPFGGIATKFGLDLLGASFNLNTPDITQLGSSILQDPNADIKMGFVESMFVEWFKNNSNQIKMPSKAEINIKLEWSNATDQA